MAKTLVLFASLSRTVLSGIACFLLAFAVNANTAEEERLWQLLEEQPQQGVVWAELALLYCQQNRLIPAQRIARYLLSQPDTPAAIRALMQEIQSGQCVKRAVNHANNEVYLQWGYDSNANLGAAGDQVILTIDGAPVVLTLTANQLARAAYFQQLGVNHQYRSSDQWGLSWAASYRRYQDMPELDQTLMALQFSHNSQILKTNLSVNQFWIGGRSLWQQLAVSGQLALSEYTDVEARLALQLYPEQAQYNSRLFQLGLRHPIQQQQQLLMLRYGLQLDLPVDSQRPGGQRQGAYMGVEHHRLIGDRVKLQLHGQWLRLFDTQAYSSLLDYRTREQDLIQFGVTASYALSNNSQCGLSLFHQRSDTNLPLFTYQQTLQYGWCSVNF